MCDTYIINKLPSTVLNDACPYQILYKKKPFYSQMRSSGCLCYPTVPIPHRSKFEPRTTPHIFVGYLYETKGYKVLSMSTKRIHVSRDVVFHENIFSFNNTSFSTSSTSCLQFPTFIDILDNSVNHGTRDNQ